jgi:hypothetical protein
LDGNAANSFNAALQAAVASEPFAAILAHQGNNSVADLEKALLKNRVLLGRD